MVRNLSHVTSALKHLRQVVNWWYIEEPTLVRNLSHVISAPELLIRVVT